MVKKQLHPTLIGTDSLCILDPANDLPPVKLVNIQERDMARFSHEIRHRKASHKANGETYSLTITPMV